jgi:predicted enzyme related to lactoylglutathione lyase
MSDRDGFQPGVPCWVETWHDDPEPAIRFYSGVLGWEAVNTLPPDADGTFHICRLRGRDAAAIGSPIPEGAPPTPVWTTFILVESAEETAAKVRDAGGRVIIEPFESLEGGRLTIVADPGGGTFAAWEQAEHKGAQVVNEPGAYSMSALQTADPEGAKAFYRELFGWEAEPFGPEEAGMSIWRLPGYVGGTPQQPVPRDNVAVMIPGAEDPARWSVDFWVFNADEAADKASELGGAIVAPPSDVPGVAGMRSAVIADPGGAVLSITQPPGVS